MCARLSHTLEPLTNLMYSKVHFKWTVVKQSMFDNMNLNVTRNNLLTYTYANK